MTSTNTAETTITPPTVAASTPTLAIGNHLSGYVVTDNATTIVYVYTSPTAIAPNTVHVTVSNFTNCYFGSQTATSCQAPVVPDPTNNKVGYATFYQDANDKSIMMTVTGAKGAQCQFSAQADDAENTKASDFKATITDYNPISVQLDVGSTLLPAWEDQSDPQPFVSASMELTDIANHKLIGLDILIWAEGWDEENALDKYFEIYTSSNGQAITTFEDVKFDSQHTYKAVRLNTGQSIFGIVAIYLKPKLGIKSGLIRLKSRLGSTPSTANSPAIYIMDPNPASGIQGDYPPDVQGLNGLQLNPGQEMIDCDITFPASGDTALVGYAITNFVGDTPPTSSAGYSILQITEKANIQYTDESKSEVKMSVPLANFHPCTQQGNCQLTDLNNVGYAVLVESGNNTFSLTTPFYLDEFVANLPQPTPNPFAEPKLFTAKADGITPDQEIGPDDWINDDAIKNGLIIQVPDTDVQGQKVQGKIYMNGANGDAYPGHEATPKREKIDLLHTPAQVQAGGLNIPLKKNVVQGFDLGTQQDSGFAVQYWIDGETNRRSTIYYNPKFDTLPGYN